MVSFLGSIKKPFFWKNMRHFLLLELESSISRSLIRKYNNFYFSSLGLTFANFCKTFDSASNVLDIWQCSEYASGSDLNMLLVNMLGFWNISFSKILFPNKIESFVSWKLEKSFLKKYKKLFKAGLFKKKYEK